MNRIYGREFSRREFLALSAMTTGGLVRAACGAPTTTTPVGLGNKPIETNLKIYNWSQYLNPDTLTQFKAAHPAMAVTQDTYASNEDMLAKIEAGARGYDIVVP